MAALLAKIPERRSTVRRNNDQGRWWTAVSKERWPDSEEFKSMLDGLWDAKYGDRRQEMVFIGLSSEMDEKAITARLDACLVDNYLSDEASFKSDNDPFPLWFQDAS